MLTRYKNKGATTSVDQGHTPQRGFQGRLELFGERTGEGFRVVCRDVGNYGKTRWEGQFVDLELEDLEAMVSELVALMQGRVQNTNELEEENEELDIDEPEELEADAMPAEVMQPTPSTTEKTV